MNLGRYDQKIKFITEGTQDDGYSGTIPQEIEVLETFAAITQLSQSRSIEQAQLGLPATFVVNVQYREGFTPTVDMRVVWKEEKYNIITTPEVSDVRMQREWTFSISK